MEGDACLATCGREGEEDGLRSHDLGRRCSRSQSKLAGAGAAGAVDKEVEENAGPLLPGLRQSTVGPPVVRGACWCLLVLAGPCSTDHLAGSGWIPLDRRWELAVMRWNYGPADAKSSVAGVRGAPRKLKLCCTPKCRSRLNSVIKWEPAVIFCGEIVRAPTVITSHLGYGICICPLPVGCQRGTHGTTSRALRTPSARSNGLVKRSIAGEYLDSGQMTPSLWPGQP